MHKNRSLRLFVAVFFSSLIIRVMFSYKFTLSTSAALYIGIPFLISLYLLFFTQKKDAELNWKWRYWNIVRDGLIIMFASSVILLEGFICVLMFLPIFLIGLTLGFISEAIWRYSKKKKSGVISAYIFPILILFSATEGTHEKLSLNRYHEVTTTIQVAQSVEQIKKNLILPIELNKNRPWFLKLFPQPYKINAESLNEGDVHEIYYRYHRWFILNTHEGRTLLKIAKVSENEIKTEFIEDTSYLSNYVTLKGTQINLNPIDNTHTEVTLKINFERKLDPSWYFKPLEEYGVGKTAEFLINEVIARNDTF